MSKGIKIAIALVAVAIVVFIIWIWRSHPEAAIPQQNQTAATPADQQSAPAGMSTDTSTDSIEEDAASVDAQMNGLGSDTSAVDSSVDASSQ